MVNKRQMIEALSPVEPKVKEMITVSNTVKTLTVAHANDYLRVLMQAQGANMRYWATGDNPSTTEGFILEDGDFLELYGDNELVDFRCIRDADTDVKLAVCYYNPKGTL